MWGSGNKEHNWELLNSASKKAVVQMRDGGMILASETFGNYFSWQIGVKIHF